MQAHGPPSPILKCSHPRPGLKEGFSVHYSPTQKCRTGDEGCAFRFVNTLWYKKCRHSRCWNDELIHGTNWIISGSRQRTSKAEDLTQTLLQNLNFNQISPSYFPHLQVFFPCLFTPSALWSTNKWWKPVNMTARSCAFPASWPNLLKNLSRMVLSKSFANAVLDSKPTGVTWRSLVNATGICSAGGTKLASCRHPHRQAAALIKSFQAARDNNTVNRAS